MAVVSGPPLCLALAEDEAVVLGRWAAGPGSSPRSGVRLAARPAAGRRALHPVEGLEGRRSDQSVSQAVDAAATGAVRQDEVAALCVSVLPQGVTWSLDHAPGVSVVTGC